MNSVIRTRLRGYSDLVTPYGAELDTTRSLPIFSGRLTASALVNLPKSDPALHSDFRPRAVPPLAPCDPRALCLSCSTESAGRLPPQHPAHLAGVFQSDDEKWAEGLPLSARMTPRPPHAPAQRPVPRLRRCVAGASPRLVTRAAQMRGNGVRGTRGTTRRAVVASVAADLSATATDGASTTLRATAGSWNGLAFPLSQPS
ncbi:hypothetical protein WOLCODRAFT_157007 [Wolfiporia cocos MD-104 SS10]|uniref:Uncharacterized protein n=1 Tax=Wolfiporia cocos (strain MD-104) TaxID=742152 RepID=A0A2H3J916_WOLCO|nr:hypothetical protein WOLCODRAFT_157007 [Wolfiporia cocos MD-104 SS10]